MCWRGIVRKSKGNVNMIVNSTVRRKLSSVCKKIIKPQIITVIKKKRSKNSKCRCASFHFHIYSGNR